MKLDPQKQDVYLGRLGREIDRLNRLIEDLLRLSRLDQDTVQLERATIDLNDLVAQIVEDRVLIAKESGLTLTFNAQEESVDLSADPGLLGQVLSVLLTNAINYTPSGKSITVSTHTKESDEVQWAGFQVSDKGAGISPDDLPHLFDRFYRGKIGRDSGVPGTGLGLAIAKGIVESHEGYIEVASEGQAKGAEFSVWFPVTVE
jgi:two-component system sensor histidine kinase ResE